MLAGVTGRLQAGGPAGVGDGGEIHAGGDVLQAGPAQRIVVGAMAVMAAQGAGGALGMVILPARVTVVHEQQHARRQRFGDGPQPVFEIRRVFGRVALGQTPVQRRLDAGDRRRDRRVGGALRPVQAGPGPGHGQPAWSLGGDAEPLDRQGIQHLVAEN
ncbi:hypothetical protein RZS08_14735, partial [Arthrospira platensis SPKY1]|nr:hypothetical protein [Arthrospira platensis SPKY1]